MKVSNPPFSAQLFQAVYGAQPQLVGASPSYYDFVTGSLPSGVTLIRASSGWRFNSAGVLVPETMDTPCFQYDPVTLMPRGLLIEDASTSVYSYTEQFDNAAWTKTRGTLTANTAAAPDGTTTADIFTEDGTASNSHHLTQSVSFVAGTTYALSVFVKANTRNWVCLSFPAAAFTSNLRNWFNVSAGTIGTTAAGSLALMQNVGGGWYRCTIIAQATTTVSSTPVINLAPSDGVHIYSGDGVSGLHVWGANLQTENTLTSYVQSVASPVVRAADVALITNANALADQCWIIRGRTPRRVTGGNISVVFQVDNGTDASRRIAYYSADGKLFVAAADGDVTQSSLDLGSVAVDTDFTIAARFADNNFAASLNGGAIVTDTSGTNPLGLTTARIGRDVAGYYWNSTIRTIETRRTASDTELPLLAA